MRDKNTQEIDKTVKYDYKINLEFADLTMLNCLQCF